MTVIPTTRSAMAAAPCKREQIPLCPEVFQRKDGQGCQKKADHDALEKAAHGHGIGDLAHQRHGGHLQKISAPVPGVRAALGDHKGENGKGQPSHDPQQPDLRKQDHAHMIRQHGEHGDDLQLVVAEAEAAFSGGDAVFHTALPLSFSSVYHTIPGLAISTAGNLRKQENFHENYNL